MTISLLGIPQTLSTNQTPLEKQVRKQKRDQFSSLDGETLVEQDIRRLKGLKGISVCSKSLKLWSVEPVGFARGIVIATVVVAVGVEEGESGGGSERE